MRDLKKKFAFENQIFSKKKTEFHIQSVNEPFYKFVHRRVRFFQNCYQKKFATKMLWESTLHINELIFVWKERNSQLSP